MNTKIIWFQFLLHIRAQRYKQTLINVYHFRWPFWQQPCWYLYGDKTSSSSSIALQRLLFQPNWPHKRGHSIAKGAKNRDKIKVAIRLSSERLLEGYQIPTQQGTYIKRRRRRLLQFHVYCVQHRIHIS